MTPVDDRVRAEIARRGPLPFDEVMDMALYDPDAGFYAAGGQAGRRGDFLTSPEIGPLFGAVVANALDSWWVEQGEPSTFVVVEAGAGPGTLARAVLAAGPACASALRYVLVESSAAQRAQHAAGLALDEPSQAFATALEPDEEREGPRPTLPPGPIVVSLAALPRLPGPCVVLANELLDNLPVGLLERTIDGWSEVRVGSHDDDLIELLVPITVDAAPSVDVPVGGRLPTFARASAWVREAIDLAGVGGRVVAFDYARPLAELAVRPVGEWLRTYRAHGPGSSPLQALGSQDITVDVAPDGLRPSPAHVTTQADWLVRHGIEALVEEGRRVWAERASIGDLAAMRARSRINEAEALLDPSGPGGFLVMEWPGR